MRKRIEYREVPGFPGYFACSDGTVWSQWQRTYGFGQRGFKTVRTEERRQLAVCLGSTGYPIVVLKCPPESKRKRVSLNSATVVALAFLGPCPEGMEVCHENGDRSDSHVGNLRYDTRKRNFADKIRHGTAQRGMKHPRAKRTDEEIRDIRRRCAAGETQESVGRTYGMRQATISSIVHRRIWKHLV